MLKRILPGLVLASAMILLTGCGKEAQQGMPAPAVRSMGVIIRDTPVVYDYSGFVEANQEMNVVSQVSGQIKEKYFKGGDFVQAGAWLYKIDQRNFYNNMLAAKSVYLSAQADADRYALLYEKEAVSKQAYENILAVRDAKLALYVDAKKNYDETIVKAPFAGRIDTSAVEVGNFALIGQTVLTKISDVDPVYVKFSISEPEYMYLVKNAKEGTGLEDVTLRLANGETYNLKGKITEVNRGISSSTGSVTCRAKFANPDRKLLPGMFAHITAKGETIKNAVLIPQRAYSEQLYKKFVFVLGADKKVTMREVTLGQTVGRLVMVESGLKAGDVVIVEGTGKLRNGMQVRDNPMQEADLDTTKIKK